MWWAACEPVVVSTQRAALLLSNGRRGTQRTQTPTEYMHATSPPVDRGLAASERPLTAACLPNPKPIPQCSTPLPQLGTPNPSP